MEEINALRKEGCTCGTEWMAPVNTLTWNLILEKTALDHATDMYTNNYFDHLSPTGTSPIQRAHNNGYSGDYVGEVIARKYFTAKDVVEAWQASESHCRALMDSLYNEMGGARKEDYWVVNLGKSK
ncbi:MAG TPA: CAP domain-containing protein [Chryseosolibacter sp.]|nr:CAP domain-containing protein [Chryseosolibacter sp.]